jgi:hypothetical protein
VAKQRNYRAEYARRNASARAAGYRSYWHQRQTQQAAQFYDGASRRAFIATNRDLPDGLSPAQVRDLWAIGDQAMRDGDAETARDVAERLGFEPQEGLDGRRYPPESAFWYH